MLHAYAVTCGKELLNSSSHFELFKSKGKRL